MKKQRANPLILIAADTSLGTAERLHAIQKLQGELHEEQRALNAASSSRLYYFLLLTSITPFLQ